MSRPTAHTFADELAATAKYSCLVAKEDPGRTTRHFGTPSPSRSLCPHI
jgi:hypothetical protein